MPKVQMPQLGESVAEGTIGKWLKKPGDHVDKYEPIVEVITDKVNAEVPSPYEGTLTEILVQEGDTVPNNTEIAVIETAGATEAAAEATPQPEPPAEPAAAAGRARRAGQPVRTAPATARADPTSDRVPSECRHHRPPSPPPKRRLSRHPATATARPPSTPMKAA